MTEAKPNLYRILVVDDDPSIREILAELMRGPRRSVEVRDNARSALEFLDHNPIDLAMLDLMMPGMNGMELAEKIRERCPQAHIVICTGYLASDVKKKGTAAVDQVVQKPFNIGEILQLAESYSEKLS
jgi:CheY-like chemotaxis protein